MYPDLHAQDFRAIYTLLGEYRELWCDPVAWQAHLLGGIARHIHLRVGLRAEVADFSPDAQPRIIAGFEHGWADAAANEIFRDGMQRGGPFTSLLDVRFRARAAGRSMLTARRADLIPLAQWRRSEVFALHHHPARMDEMLTSALRLGVPGHVHLLSFGGTGHRPTPRDAQFLELHHREFLPLLGAPLATTTDFSLHGLSPRRREIFTLACTGLAEKAIADRLGLSPATVNESLQNIYAHFGVRTRPQLMAYLLQREPRGRSLER